MDLQQYLTLFRKWVWLVIVVVGIAVASSYYYTRQVPPVYQASTTLLVGQALQNPNPNNGEFNVAAQLAGAYATLVGQQPILQATVDALNYQLPWQSLYGKTSASVVGGQLLVITVRDTNPRRAADIANEVAHQLILQSPTSVEQKRTEDQRAFVTSQMNELKTQVEKAQQSLGDLTTRAAVETDANKLKDLTSRIDALQTKIDTWQQNYAQLSSTLNSTSTNFLTVITPADVPGAPVSPNMVQNLILAGLVGLLVAVSGIFIIEFLDDTIKDAADLQRVLKLSMLGAITSMNGLRKPGDGLITLKNPRSPNAEAYRVLRTNLRFAGMKNPGGSLLVTSTVQGEGKTTTAANLAVILAHADKRIVLVDTDLRNPQVHRIFGLTNDIGLSSLFLSDDMNRDKDRVMQVTQVEGLSVITSGPLPPNPAEMLDSKQMMDIIEGLVQDSDMVIFDAPPVLGFADASIMASRCYGTLLVIDAAHTRTQAIRRAVETLARSKGKVLGAVLNKVHPRQAPDSYYYQYPATQNSNARASAPK